MIMNNEFNIEPDVDPVGREETNGNIYKHRPLKICVNCKESQALAKKTCSNCKRPLPKSSKPKPLKTLKSTNVTRMKHYLKKYADTMCTNSGCDVIILYGSHHTRSLKNGNRTTVFDIGTYATNGFGTHFLGEGKMGSRPDVGAKVIKLLKASMQAYYSKKRSEENRIMNVIDETVPNSDVNPLGMANEIDVANGPEHLMDPENYQSEVFNDMDTDESDETVIFRNLENNLSEVSNDMDIDESDETVELRNLENNLSKVSDETDNDNSDEEVTLAIPENIQSEVLNETGNGRGIAKTPDVTGPSHLTKQKLSNGKKERTAKSQKVGQTSHLREQKLTNGKERRTAKRPKLAQASNLKKQKPSDGKEGQTAESSKVTQPSLSTKKKLSKGLIEYEWTKFRGSKLQIFWPHLTDGIDDMWGNKFWDCEFANETKKEVDVCYQGSFTDLDGTRGFNSNGQCIVRSSKASLLRDWDIRIIQ